MITNSYEQIRRYRAAIPDKHNGAYRRKYDKAMRGRSIRAAIDIKCLDCMSWQATEVKDCPVVTCTLHPYRPYRRRQNTAQSSPSAPQSSHRGYSGKKSRPKGSLAGVKA